MSVTKRTATSWRSDATPAHVEMVNGVFTLVGADGAYSRDALNILYAMLGVVLSDTAPAPAANEAAGPYTPKVGDVVRGRDYYGNNEDNLAIVCRVTDRAYCRGLGDLRRGNYRNAWERSTPDPTYYTFVRRGTDEEIALIPKAAAGLDEREGA